MGTLMITTKDQMVDLGFTDKEIEAYLAYKAANKPHIAAATALNFYHLFLEGFEPEKLAEKFPQWGLGAIVDARIRYQWDRRKVEYVNDLHRRVTSRAVKFQYESMDFMQNLAAVTHIKFNKEMMEYIQNPTKENIPNTMIHSIREYKDLIAAMDQLTKLGQPAVPVTPGEHTTVNVVAENGSKVEISSGSDLLKKMADLKRES